MESRYDKYGQIEEGGKKIGGYTIFLCEDCIDKEEKAPELFTENYNLRLKLNWFERKVESLEKEVEGVIDKDLREQLQKLEKWVIDFYKNEMTEEQRNKHYDFLHRGHGKIDWII